MAGGIETRIPSLLLLTRRGGGPLFFVFVVPELLVVADRLSSSGVVGICMDRTQLS